MNYGDILIHIDEELEDRHILALERALVDQPGVYSACVNDRKRHLMLVDYDPEAVQPSGILHSVRGRGLHAEMIGF
jgi:hypothetical protein